MNEKRELQVITIRQFFRTCSNFSVAGKFCLAHGLRQLTRDTKGDCDVICIQTPLTRRNKKFGVGRSVNCKHFKEMIQFYTIIGKKNNQSSLSDADRENPTLGSTNDAGNSVNLVSDIIHLLSGWNSSICIGDRIFRGFP